MDLASADKEALFEELVELIVSASPLKLERSVLLGCIMEREALMATSIRSGVALPHGKTDTIDRIVGAIGVSKGGVDYDAFDEMPVHLVFMLVSPKHDPESHLGVLKRLAAIMDIPGFIDSLIRSKDSSSAFAVLGHYEDLLGHA